MISRNKFLKVAASMLQKLIMTGEANVLVIQAVALRISSLPEKVKLKDALHLLGKVLAGQAHAGNINVNGIIAVIDGVRNEFVNGSPVPVRKRSNRTVMPHRKFDSPSAPSVSIGGLELISLEGLNNLGDLDGLSGLDSVWGKFVDRMHKARDAVAGQISPRVKNITDATIEAAKAERDKLKADKQAVQTSTMNPEFNLKVLWQRYPAVVSMVALFLAKRILFR